MLLTITNIQRFCMHDGPGMRTTVFFKGCPLRCQWCHNPETQERCQQVLYHASRCIQCGACGGEHRASEVCPAKAIESVGQLMDVQDVVKEVEKDRAFYGAQGGVTLSGGEPMFQPEAALSLLRACRERGMNTAVETSGFFEKRYLPDLVRHADLLLWDFKDSDDLRHRQYTGSSNRLILENLMRADALGAAIRLRCILVEGVNADEAHYSGIAQLWHRLTGAQSVELLPYHTYGGSKHEALYGRDDGRKAWIPSQETMARAREALEGYGVKVV